MADFNPTKHLTKLQGKDYLEVKWRLVWFRDDHPGGAISTEILSTQDVIIVRATVSVDGVYLATGHGTAPLGGKGSWTGREIEKAETAAIGRALAHAGYGTQFTGEDEEDLADSPVERKQNNKPAPKQSAQKQSAPKQDNIINMEPPANATQKRKDIWEQVKNNYSTYDAFEDHLARISDQLTANSSVKQVVDLLTQLPEAK